MTIYCKHNKQEIYLYISFFIFVSKKTERMKSLRPPTDFFDFISIARKLMHKLNFSRAMFRAVLIPFWRKALYTHNIFIYIDKVKKFTDFCDYFFNDWLTCYLTFNFLWGYLKFMLPSLNNAIRNFNVVLYFWNNYL